MSARGSATSPASGVGVSVAWSAHLQRRERRTRLLHGAVAVLAVLGGLGTLAGWIVPDSDPPNRAAAGSVSAAQLVGAFSMDFVTRYLSSKSGDEKALTAYITAPAITLPNVAATVSDPWVVYTKLITNSAQMTTWTAVVSLRIDAAVNPDRERAYFRTSVSVFNGAPRALSLPQRVEAPHIGVDATLAYPVTADPGTDLHVLATGFLSAYLTGREDLSRYTTADTILTAIRPSPYTAISMVTVQVDRPASDASSLHLLMTVDARTTNYSVTRLQYWVTAVNSAGRWQVRAFDDQPLINPGLSTPDPSHPSSAAPASPTQTGGSR
ncbi:conjugal transfer protein [Nocardia altamirensis]|uniref:conjugal transfer protein n=1 Tax=Nocardia altamirensis TaxID=472158 RepID=UPI00083FDB4B|nr:conjugal transfer protein [Nocardia altamirensis]